MLPFHQVGRYKWVKLGLDYTLDGAQLPSNDQGEAACLAFREEGLQAY